MEESIKKAEELIEATNAALARMQCDASGDDITFIKQADRKKGRKLGFDDVRHVLSPREKILETDNEFGLNKRHSIRADEIDEINSKIEAYKLELLKRENVESMRALHSDRDESAPVTRTNSNTNLSQRTVIKIKPSNLAEDLKSKLKQTQEIVDRGIQTARELNETVEVLKSARQSKSDELSLCKSEKNNRSESGSTVEGKRCKRCNTEMTQKTAKGTPRKKEDNVLVTRVRGRDSSSPRRRHHLNFQQLPSLKIQGDLSCQRILIMDIPPGKREGFPQRANTAFETYSHEEIIRDGIDKIVEGIKSSNASFPLDNTRRTKSVECLNCGKVMRVVPDKIVRSDQIDELLKSCDYNVFDPRIDEFVERFGGKKEEEAKYTQTELDTPERIEIPPKVEIPKIRISDLSRELTRKYREKATELERDHLEFENILRDLSDKMEESRAVLKNCDYLNTIVEAGKRKASLSVTPPAVLSYTGSGEEADDGRNAVLRPNRIQKTKSKVIRKKLGKKELEINCKLISSSSPTISKPETIHIETTTQKPKTSKPIGRIEKPSTDREKLKKELVNRNSAKPLSPPPKKPIKPIPEIIVPASKPIPPVESVQINPNEPEESIKQTNIASDYESDFEEESSEEKSQELEADDNSYKYNARLSTISEVESESDRKATDEGRTPRESNGKIEELVQKTDEAHRTRSKSSSDEDDTRKLLERVNRDLKEVALQQSISTKKSETIQIVSEEVAEPLKEVLNALKNQFERTEILADRLTDSIKEVKKTEEMTFSNGHRDLLIVNNLKRARKRDQNGKEVFPPTSYPLSPPLLGKSEKSLPEMRSIREEIQTLSSSGSVGNKGSISTGKSYSEGEISEQEILVSDRSSPSIGEVINENHSDGSLLEEKSEIKFV